MLKLPLASPFLRAITSGKKNAGTNDAPLVRSLAPAFDAPASCDVQDDFSFAVPAINREIVCLGVFTDPKQPFIPAHRTDNPSVLYDKFTGILWELQ